VQTRTPTNSPSEWTTVAIPEYGEATITMSSSQERQVRAIAQQRLAVLPTGGPDEWAVRATSFVGTVVVPGVRILVTPKVSSANLFYLLEAGGRSLDIGAEQFDYDRTKDLVASFATFYARHLERIASQGIPRSYVEHDDRLLGPRGRVDLPPQRRSTGLPLPVACRFDEYTADVPLNRVLREAAERLGRLPGVTVESRRALRSWIAAYPEIGPLRASDLAIRSTFTRLDQHCRPAAGLARLVLAGSSLSARIGTAGAGVFMINMNSLFEEFVEHRLRRELRGRLVVHGQRSSAFDLQGAARIQPDLVFTDRAGRDVYVGDSKYKVTTSGFATPASDYYQLLAYLTVLDVAEGVLVYCQNDGDVPQQVVEVLNSGGKRLRSWAVHLGGTSKAVDARMAELADRVVAWSIERSAAPVRATA
jgi:5-methylcytosine-specific restriction enzyme subunit McrC